MKNNIMFCMMDKRFKSIADCQYCQHNFIGGPCKYYRNLDDIEDFMRKIRDLDNVLDIVKDFMC